MYNKVSNKLQFVENEAEVLKFWNEEKIFEKSIDEKRIFLPIHFMMALQQLMVCLTSAMFLQE